MTKTNKVIYYVLMVLVTLAFLFAGYSKVTGDAQQIQGFAVAHLPVWFMYFIGVAEILGAIGLWIPKLQKWAVYGLMIIMAGAVIVTAIFQTIAMAIAPLVIGIILYGILSLGKKGCMSAPVAPAAPTQTV